MKEAELQAFVESLVERGDLLSKLSGREKPDQALAALRDPAFYPTFPVDYLMRKHTAEAARDVLRRLSILDQVSSSVKNVSLTTGESLFADLVYCNPEYACFVIVELKRSNETARQTITELLAYEHEIRNHLPFIDNKSICFVVIATEYSVLLDHSIAGLVTWHGKSVLCLQAATSTIGISLAVHLPSSWAPIGQRELPEEAVQTVHLCPYPSNELDEDRAAAVAHTALQLICRDGESSHGHGFVILWRDAFFPEPSLSPYMLTVGVINPFAFIPDAVRQGLIAADASPLSAFLTTGDTAAELTSASNWTGVVGSTAVRYLKQFGSPCWEGFVNWKDGRRQNTLRCFPIECELWGFLGDFARDIVTRDALLKNFMPEFAVPGLDWTEPRFAIRIIDQVALRSPAASGEFSCQALLHLGVRLGRLASLAAEFRGRPADKRSTIKPSLFWAETDLVPLLSEVLMRYIAAKDLKVPPPHLKLGGYADQPDIEKQVTTFCRWIEEEFIGKRSEIHRMFFAYGLRYHFLYDRLITGGLSDQQLLDARHGMASESKDILKGVVGADLDPASTSANGSAVMERFSLDYGIGLPEGSAVTELCNAIDNVGDDVHVSNFWEALPEIVDIGYPQLFHQLAPPQHLSHDWDWLRDQIKKLTASASGQPYLLLTPGGDVGTAVDTKKRYPFPKVSDLDKEVLVCRNESGIAIFTVMTWEELRAGALSKGFDGNSGEAQAAKTPE